MSSDCLNCHQFFTSRFLFSLLSFSSLSLSLSPIVVLVGLYEEPERPPNAVDYVKRYMGAPTGVDVEAIRSENDSLKKEVAELKATIEELNARRLEGEGEEA